MERENKKIILNVIFAIAMFFAIMGTAQILFNAINMLAFNISDGRYNQDFYRYISVLSLIAAIISIIGLVYLLFFAKKGGKTELTFIGSIFAAVFLSLYLSAELICLGRHKVQCHLTEISLHRLERVM